MSEDELLKILRARLIANEETNTDNLSSWAYGVICGKAALLEELIVEVSGKSTGI